MIITRTPFRISFFGGGTDYPVWYEKNGGAVISTSIDKYCYITARYLPPFFDCNYRIRYTQHEETKTLEEIQHPSVRECLAHLKFEKGIEMQHNTDVPGKSGLGSSSAFTVGLLNALYALQGKMVTKKKLALDALHVEQGRIKENVGSQDQVVAAFGGFNKIEFGGRGKIKVDPLALDSGVMNALQDHLMLFFTGYPRYASTIAVEQIQNTHNKTQELHVMREMVDEGVRILESGTSRLADFGTLLHDAWQIKRTLSSKIATPFIDEAYAAARSAGAIGGKLLGAGGGGCMLIFAAPEHQAAIRARLQKLVHIPFRFENNGSQIIYQMPNDQYV